MKKALIEDSTGRVVQVVSAEDVFPVATGLSWMDCADEVRADAFQVIAGKIEAKPVKEEDSPKLTREQKLLALLQEKGVISADEAKLD